MTIRPSKKMSGRGLYVGVCPITGCSWTTRTTTKKEVQEALGQHLVDAHTAETPAAKAAEQEKECG